VVRLSHNLTQGGLIVFTLKAAGADTPAEMIGLIRAAVAYGVASGLALIARTHLTYNRQEFTLFFERP
jgi:23S rRNA (cytidine2498-2'-O)-methyltransferase